jgi:HEAT repeat protein
MIPYMKFFLKILIVATSVLANTVSAAPIDHSKEVADAIHAIQREKLDAMDAVNLLGGDIKNLHDDNYSSDAIYLLINTKEDIDDDLLALAQSDKSLGTRTRAVHILAFRSDKRVIPIIGKMVSSESVEERYDTWRLYQRALEQKKLPVPADAARIIELDNAENDLQVRELIEWFIGAARLKEARSLMEERALASSEYLVAAVWALGEIGDKRSVPVLIRVFTGTNRDFSLESLGKIATPEAVDFIIRHLDSYHAPEALYTTKSEKAMPALKAHLNKIDAGKIVNQNMEINRAATRVAIIRLSEKQS